MARVDVFRRIKNDKIIEGRIQKYRLHFDYLKTFLEYSEFKVDKKHYSSCKLNLVKTLSLYLISPVATASANKANTSSPCTASGSL